MSNCIILGYSVTIGLPEIVIFLLAAILLGFSIHFYWAGKRSVPGLKQPTLLGDTDFGEDDQWRLQFYEQIEKHEKTQDGLERELKRMADAEKILIKELDETREEVSRLEKIAEKVSVSGDVAPSRNTISDLVMAQQNLHESLSREMAERLERAYEEFNFLQDRIQKIESQVVDPQNRSFESDEVEQSYFRITKEYDELKLKQLTLMEENQQLTRALADAEEKLRDANFSKQQLARKVTFLEELTQDLQQLSGHHKKLEGQLKRISEIEALLARKS
jgi:hypothetical protein